MGFEPGAAEVDSFRAAVGATLVAIGGALAAAAPVLTFRAMAIGGPFPALVLPATAPFAGALLCVTLAFLSAAGRVEGFAAPSAPFAAKPPRPAVCACAAVAGGLLPALAFVADASDVGLPAAFAPPEPACGCGDCSLALLRDG